MLRIIFKGVQITADKSWIYYDWLQQSVNTRWQNATAAPFCLFFGNVWTGG